MINKKYLEMFFKAKEEAFREQNSKNDNPLNEEEIQEALQKDKEGFLDNIKRRGN